MWVRNELRRHSARRKQLDEICAQLEMPMPQGLLHQHQLAGRAGAVGAAAGVVSLRL